MGKDFRESEGPFPMIPAHSLAAAREVGITNVGALSAQTTGPGPWGRLTPGGGQGGADSRASIFTAPSRLSVPRYPSPPSSFLS